MSLISDALKKAELQRAQPSLARVSVWDQPAQANSNRAEPTARTSSRGLFFANVAVLVIICVAAVYFVRNDPMAGSESTLLDPGDRPDAAPSEFASVDSASVPSSTFEQKPLTPAFAESPFMPPSVAATNQPPVTDEYDLGGTSTLGANTLLSVVRRSDRRSMWIPVGKTIGEVTAVSYDPETDQAVIRVRGNLLSVTMSASTIEPADSAEPEAESAE